MSPKESELNSHDSPMQHDPVKSEEFRESRRKLEETKTISDGGKSSRSSSDSPQLSLSDLQLNQDYLDRYLSEGEVLSQGEIQLGLSDDDVPDNF